MNRKSLNLSLGLICIIFLFTRLYNLTKLPIFTDEAMYLNWGKLIWHDWQKNLFISLTDGQQPFFLWLTTLSYGFGKGNILFWGRIISVLSGLGTVGMLILIGKKIFNQTLGILAAFFYVLSPFALWYDRLTIKDSFLLLLAVIIFYLSLEKITIKRSLLIGVILGIALLTKSIAYFYIGLLFSNAVLLSFSRNFKFSFKSFWKYCRYFVLSLGIGYGMSQVMRFSSAFDSINSKNQVFLLPLTEFLQNPFQLIKHNTYSSVSWIIGYISLPILLTSFLGMVHFFRKIDWRLGAAIGLWGLVPLGFEIFMARIFFPRYFLIILLPISIFFGCGLYWIYDLLVKKIPKSLVIVLLGLVFLPNVILAGEILTDPRKAKLPEIEKWQYIDGWPSGYGLWESIKFINDNYLLNNKPVSILAENVTLIPSGYELYFENNPLVQVEPNIPTHNDIDFARLPLKKNVINLIALSNRGNLPKDWPVNEVFKASRPGEKTAIRLFEVDFTSLPYFEK
jgi:4-amino-4-deoxy-L-arabinose transferase-like glycosyltransferase